MLALQLEGNVPRTVMQKNPYSFAIASVSVSNDGRAVAFESIEQLLPEDTNPVR